MCVHIASLRNSFKDAHELDHKPLQIPPFPVQLLQQLWFVFLLYSPPILSPFWYSFEFLISATYEINYKWFIPLVHNKHSGGDRIVKILAFITFASLVCAYVPWVWLIVTVITTKVNNFKYQWFTGSLLHSRAANAHKRTSYSHRAYTPSDRLTVVLSLLVYVRQCITYFLLIQRHG